MASLSGQAFAVVEVNNKNKTELLKNPIAGIEQQSRLYYKIGGARPISTPPVNYSEIDVGGQLKFGAGYSCGKFDPTLSLQNFMNNLKQGVDDAMNTMQGAATSAIASLPTLMLQRNSPDIYELLQTNVFRAEEKFKFNASSCQEMESQIAKGENPYKQWTMFAQSSELKEETESNPDANEAMKKVQESGGDKGIYFPVPGKGVVKAGGVDQEPIKVTSSATVVGYNTMLKRAPTEMSEPTEQTNLKSRLVRTFPTPAAAIKWVSEVIGERDIYTTDNPNTQPSSVAGTGILAKTNQSQSEVKLQLKKALTTTNLEDRAKVLSELEVEGVSVTTDLLDKIQSSSSQELFIESLSTEIALGQQIDKALLARRLLLSSLSDSNLSSAQQVSNQVKSNVKDLEDEIDRAMFEYRLRKELVSNLAETIYEDARSITSTPVRKAQADVPQFEVR